MSASVRVCLLTCFLRAFFDILGSPVPLARVVAAAAASSAMVVRIGSAKLHAARTTGMSSQAAPYVSNLGYVSKILEPQSILSLAVLWSPSAMARLTLRRQAWISSCALLVVQFAKESSGWLNGPRCMGVESGEGSGDSGGVVHSVHVMSHVSHFTYAGVLPQLCRVYCRVTTFASPLCRRFGVSNAE